MIKKEIYKRLYQDYSKKYLDKIILSAFFSILVAGSTSSIAWLLDPAIKKLFIEKDQSLIIFIPLMIIVAFTLLYATPLLFNLPQATLGIIVIFAVLPLIRIKKMKDLYNNNKELGFVAWITFFSTLLFPLFSFELFEGVTTHIWTGIIFGFIIHLIFKKIFTREES